MPKAVRLGDTSTGHPHCYPARPNTTASPDVIINGRGAHRIGDGWAIHGACEDHTPHGGSAASGSPTIIVNGKALCRIGDAIDCGDTMATGSDDVIGDG